LNTPLRQLIEMHLVESLTAEDDKRKRMLRFTREGAKLEQALRREQIRLIEKAFNEAGEEAVSGWLAVNQALTNLAHRNYGLFAFRHAARTKQEQALSQATAPAPAPAPARNPRHKRGRPKSTFFSGSPNSVLVFHLRAD